MTDITVAANLPEPEWGPAMRALHPLWQKAVVALFLTGGNRTAAIKAAGYRCTTPKSFNAMASKLFADARVKAAIAEECLSRLAVDGPEMLSIVAGIARNTEAKDADRLAATRIFLDRSLPVQTTHTVKVEHHLTVDETDIQHYRALQKLGAPQQAFLDRFGVNGLPRVEAMIAAEAHKQKQLADQAGVIDLVDAGVIEGEWEAIDGEEDFEAVDIDDDLLDQAEEEESDGEE